MFSFPKIFFNVFTAFSLFAHPHIIVHHRMINQIITPSPTISQPLLRATGSVSQFGKTAYLNAVFPQNGGEVTGNISGDCTGKVKGTYSGDANGKQLQGTGYATCHVLFFNVDGTSTFSGIVNDSDTSTDVHYTVAADNQSQSGTFTFTISPVL